MLSCTLHGDTTLEAENTFFFYLRVLFGKPYEHYHHRRSLQRSVSRKTCPGSLQIVYFLGLTKWLFRQPLQHWGLLELPKLVQQRQHGVTISCRGSAGEQRLVELSYHHHVPSRAAGTSGKSRRQKPSVEAARPSASGPLHRTLQGLHEDAIFVAWARTSLVTWPLSQCHTPSMHRAGRNLKHVSWSYLGLV